jgi:hypothetical protein
MILVECDFDLKRTICQHRVQDRYKTPSSRSAHPFHAALHLSAHLFSAAGVAAPVAGQDPVDAHLGETLH